MFEHSAVKRSSDKNIKRLPAKIVDILKRQSVVLDVGCANWWLSHYVSPSAKYIGLSYSHADIDKIKKDWHEGLLVNLDTEKIALEDGSVDCIFASHVMEHFDKVRTIEIMNEFRRVLKKWGYIILTTPTDYNSFFYAEWTHVRPYNHWSLPGLLRDFEFKEVDWMYPKISFLSHKLQALLRFPLFFLKDIFWNEVTSWGIKK